jgi:hypothetical protein
MEYYQIKVTQIQIFKAMERLDQYYLVIIIQKEQDKINLDQITQSFYLEEEPRVI